MAGTPTEEPQQFVCMNCYNISAGIPAEGSHDYEPPVECGACSADDFVEFARFRLAYKERR